MPGGPIETLFVANRGEIARRIAATAERLGIRAVVPDLDAPGAVDLLDAGSVVAAALAAGADAVHPGYGFLAEDPALARAVLDAGLTWVGPPPEAIRALGDKAEARAIARGVGRAGRGRRGAGGPVGRVAGRRPRGGSATRCS